MTTLAQIRALTARRFGISPRHMRSPSRLRKYARPRQVAMYLSRTLTNKSLAQIAAPFARDHTTVIHAVRQVEKLRAEDGKLDRKIRRLAKALEGGCA